MLPPLCSSILATFPRAKASPWRLTFRAFLAAAVACAFGTKLSAEPPVRFEIDAGKRHAISPYIYGMNQPNWSRDRGLVTLVRWGGNRTTAYNWETNASNAGADWRHQNDAYLCASDAPGEAVRRAVGAAHAAGAAALVTVPILGYVAADSLGGGDVAKTPDYLRKRFFRSLPTKNLPRSFPPDVLDAVVYQDEFVAWLEGAFPQARRNTTQTIFYALDNEPELWPTTHPRLHSRKTSYEEIVRLNIEYAAAIKSVVPQALVFGPVSYGWNGFTSLQDAPDARGRDFLDFYLAEMRAAERRLGRRLLDVLDIHWYPAALGGKTPITEDSVESEVARARVQAPRSLWDSRYVEDSWITKHGTHGPIRLLPRLQEKIAKHYPGTKLAVTEYYFGAGGDISGALAQADALGIFGREGVFAAALWHLGKSDDRFIRAAFTMFRDFDGHGSQFGGTGIAATTSDVERTSVYASLDASGRVVIMAVNKSNSPLLVDMRIKHAPASVYAETYFLMKSQPRPVRGNDALVGSSERLQSELPANSVAVFRLAAPPRQPTLPRRP